MSSDAVASTGAGTSSKWLILGTATFCTILYAMAVTIASVALPDMRGAMSATQDQITWTITGNIVATAVATPLAGWFAGRYEVRPILLVSVIGFILSTLACGMAQTLEQLVVARVAQGAFGAPLVPLAQAIVLAVFPASQRSLSMSVWSMGAILGPIIAPTLGGYLGEHFGWRWIFFLMVPFGGVALGCIMLFIPKLKLGESKPLDWTGFLALAVAMAALQIMFDRGERNGWFDSMETVIEASIAALGFYLFVAQCVTAKRPFLDIGIFKDRNYTLGLFLVFFFGMLNFVPMVLFPPLLQELRGYPQSIIGLLMGSRGFGTFIGFTLMAFAGRVDPRIPMTVGFFLQGYAGWVMAGFGINLTTWDVAWTSALQGFGVGLCWVPVTVVAFSTLNPKLIPEATALFQLLRNLASSMFISISVAVVLRTGTIAYAESAADLNVWAEGLRHITSQTVWDIETLRGLAGLSSELQRQSLMIGYINAFKMFAITSFLAIPLIFLLKVGKRG
ncbi:MAG: DHA2 family efflux MFS transporter permease subunit [Pseudomonadota bacterium]